MSDENILPHHVGIIMDGNGRWAKKRGLPRKAGHKVGADAFKRTVRYANKLGIKYLTVYAFSTENWKRPEDEIKAIIEILRRYLSDAKNYKSENVRTKFIGDLSVFDDDILKKIAECEDESSDFTGLNLNIAINYGGQNEILNATKLIAEDIAQNNLTVDNISLDLFKEKLYTNGQPEVDLIIRPSGEQRLSNFMIFQSAYAELIFMDVLWPDFDEKCFDRALDEFAKRNRRFGGL